MLNLATAVQQLKQERDADAKRSREIGRGHQSLERPYRHQARFGAWSGRHREAEDHVRRCAEAHRCRATCALGKMEGRASEKIANLTA